MPSAEKLSAEVEGDIEDVNGVLKITQIRLRYAVECPAYQTVKGCIDCTWTAEIEEA